MFEEVAEDVIIDYNGNSALSAYAPITIFNDTTWALLAEIDQARGNGPNKIYDEAHTDNRGGDGDRGRCSCFSFCGRVGKTGRG